MAYDEGLRTRFPRRSAWSSKKRSTDLTAKLTAAEMSTKELTKQNTELEKEVKSLTAEIVALKDAAIKAEGTDKGAKAKDTGKGSKAE